MWPTVVDYNVYIGIIEVEITFSCIVFFLVLIIFSMPEIFTFKHSLCIRVSPGAQGLGNLIESERIIDFVVKIIRSKYSDPEVCLLAKNGV